MRSAHDDSAYPPPSCSAFHGRSGSSECADRTCGTPCSSPARWPPRFAYQVCECTRSAPATSSAICRSTPNVPSAAFAPDRTPGTE
ncbi:Uncharacterised protein [Mycobacteroides abscessus]|nr:Uncharacterised protein [Mycobacteroides abscessus]